VAKTLSTLETGLVAAGTGQLLRCLVEVAEQEGLSPTRADPYLLVEEGVVAYGVGLVGAAVVVWLLACRAAVPLRAPLGTFVAGCAVALGLGVPRVDEWWREVSGQTVPTLLLLGAGLAAGLALALRPPLRARAPRRAAGLAVALTLLAGAPLLREEALDLWPKDYPEFGLELVPLRLVTWDLRPGEEGWCEGPSGLCAPAGEGDRLTHALDRQAGLRLGRDDVVRVSWTDAPTGARIRLTDRAAARLRALSSDIIGQQLAVFLNGECLLQPQVQQVLGRHVVISEGSARDPKVRALYAGLTGEEAPARR
jgi:hypothetical protein